MGATNDTPVKWRGIRERTLADQAVAMVNGYTSVEQWAIDELARRVIALEIEVFGAEQGVTEDPADAQLES